MIKLKIKIKQVIKLKKKKINDQSKFFKRKMIKMKKKIKLNFIKKNK